MARIKYKRVYIVKGSEDGIIEVCGSVSKALARAEGYIGRKADAGELASASEMRRNGEWFIDMYADTYVGEHGSFGVGVSVEIQSHIVD